MSNFRKFISMSAVAILGATNLLAPLSYASAATGYDSLSEDDLKHSALRFEMPNRDVFLYAITEANKYFVEYSGTTKTSGEMGRDEFTYDIAGNLSGNKYAKTGYTFSGWNRDPNGNGTGYADGATGVVYNWTTTENGVVPVYAQWNANKYNINYNLNDSTGTSNAVHNEPHPESLNYDQTGNVTNPSRTGYTFSGWTITNMDSEKHIVGGEVSSATTEVGVKGTVFKNLRATSGTVNFLAIWSPKQVPYIVKHYLQDLNGAYTILTGTDHLTGTADEPKTPDNKHYVGFTDATPYSENINADGSTVFTYNYPRNSYDLTLNAGRGIASVTATGTVNTAGASTSTSTSVSFKYEEPVVLAFTYKSGYENGTWSGYKDTSSSFTMPAFSTGKTAYATPIVYNITYTMNGGTNNAANPSKYTVESGDITLQDPTGTNSDFLGWTGTDVAGTSKTVTITSGSIGNRSYTAQWKCHIGYHASDAGPGNCIANTDTEFTIEYYHESLTGANVLVETGRDSGTTDTQTAVTGKVYEGFTLVEPIHQENINGDKSTVVKVYYTRDQYSSTITNTTGITGANADGQYSDEPNYKYGDKVTLTADTLPGYTFSGWTVSGPSGDVVVTNPKSIDGATFVMPAGDVTITPHVTVDVYHLTIISHGGQSGSVSRTYTVEDTVELTNPTRPHSDFAGWSGTDLSEPTMYVEFSGRAKDSIYEETWKCHTGYHASGTNECVANEYQGKVDYDDGEHGAPETISFTYDQVTNLPNPQQSGYIFSGWKITGMSGGVEHIIGTLPVTGNTVDSTKATEFKNLSTEQGMTDITFTAIWTPRDDTPYKVYHYYQNTGDNNYTLSGTAVEYSGTTDEGIDLNRIMENTFGFHNHAGVGTYGAYTGGTVNGPEGASKTEITIDKYGNTVIYFYYDRNEWNVYLSGDEHVATLSGAGVYRYGADVTVTATAKTGYHFKTWKRKTDNTFTTDL